MVMLISKLFFIYFIVCVMMKYFRRSLDCIVGKGLFLFCLEMCCRIDK